MSNCHGIKACYEGRAFTPGYTFEGIERNDKVLAGSRLLLALLKWLVGIR